MCLYMKRMGEGRLLEKEVLDVFIYEGGGEMCLLEIDH